ncbi:MAG: Bug family tripartite tricarboxylate transporter substrate binding protein [Ramlibacter sp.]
MPDTPLLHSAGRRRLLVALASSAALITPSSFAQASAESLRILVGFPAGSSSDVSLRTLVSQMQGHIKRPIVVENRPGASGRIAVDAVRTARPDGLTLLYAPHGPMTLFPHVFKRLSYDPARDFTPISQVAAFDFGLFANAGVPATNLQELKTWAQSNPALATYGSPGIGTTPHFLTTALAQKAGMRLTHVPFASPPQIMSSLVGGHLGLSMGPIDEALPFIRDGKVKALGTSGTARSALLPQVPTFTEQGVKLDLLGWFGLFAPVGVEPALLADYERAVQNALATAEVKARFASMNLKPTGTSATELGRIRREESVMWSQVVKETGFTPED